MCKELVKVKQIHLLGLDEVLCGGDSLDDLEGESVKLSQSAGLDSLAQLIRNKDRGYQGTQIKCSKCGKQHARYKSDEYRTISIIFGEIEFLRSRYICADCNHSFYPLDEELKLTRGKYQGRMKKRLEAIGISMPYQSSESLSGIFLEKKVSAMQVRQLVNNCSSDFSQQHYKERQLKINPGDNVYLQIDGNMCPTRDTRKSAQDHGYREAKTAVAFTGVTEISKNRHEILDKAIMSKICNAEEFSSDLQNFLAKRIPLGSDNQVVVIADGAHWIWNIVAELLPQAQCILDYTHAKQYLYKAAEIIFGANNDICHAWIKRQEELLFQDQVLQVIENIKIHESQENLANIIAYLDNHKSKMFYGTYQKKGFFIGSGTVESVAKSLTQTRLKGPGMRWNIPHANNMLALRAALTDKTLLDYWKKLPLAA